MQSVIRRVELNETIVVIFTSPNAVFANNLNTYAQTFTINDDDDATIIPNNVTVPSSASTFSIDLNLSSLSGQNISIDVVDNTIQQQPQTILIMISRLHLP